MASHNNTPQLSTDSGSTFDDQFDLTSIVLNLWVRKWIIGGVAIISLLIGTMYAFLAPEVYRSKAIIGPREGKGSSSVSNLSTLVPFGGVMAAQLGIGNSDLDWLVIRLRSRSLAKRILVTHNMFPVVFPEEHKDFLDQDSSRQVLRKSIENLRSSMLFLEPDDKKNIITIGVDTHSPSVSCRLVRLYLDGLCWIIREDVRDDSENNRLYLERQLSLTPDALLKEKIEGLIANEIERFMLISARPVHILEEPIEPIWPIAPKRRAIVVFALFTGLTIGIIISLVTDVIAPTISRVSSRMAHSTSGR